MKIKLKIKIEPRCRKKSMTKGRVSAFFCNFES